MSPMMNPMAGMMAMQANAMRAMASGGEGEGDAGGAAPEAPLAELAVQLASLQGTTGAGTTQDVGAKIEALEEGSKVHVEYTHPQLGRTRYEGVLKEKFEGASHLQSYIELPPLAYALG